MWGIIDMHVILTEYPYCSDTSTVDTGKCSQRQAELFIAQQVKIITGV